MMSCVCVGKVEQDDRCSIKLEAKLISVEMIMTWIIYVFIGSFMSLCSNSRRTKWNDKQNFGPLDKVKILPNLKGVFLLKNCFLVIQTLYV